MQKLCLVGIGLLFVFACDRPSKRVDDAPPLTGVTKSAFTRIASSPGAAETIVLDDRDTTSGINFTREIEVAASLVKPTDLWAVKVYAQGGVRIRVQSSTTSGERFGDISSTEVHGTGWARIPSARTGRLAERVVVTLTPLGGDARITELEAWANAENIEFLSAEKLAAVPESHPGLLRVRPDPDHAELTPGGSGDEDVAAPTCVRSRFAVAVNPASLGRVFLTYRARGIAGTFALTTTINGKGRSGGVVAPADSEIHRYFERIPAALLVSGENHLEICGPAVGATTTRIEDMQVVLQADSGAAEEPFPEDPALAFLDSDPSTQGSVRTELIIPLRLQGSVDGVLIRHPQALDPAAVSITVDAAPAATQWVNLGADLDLLALTVPASGSILTVKFLGPTHIEDIVIVGSTLGAVSSHRRLVIDQPRDQKAFGNRAIVTGFVEGGTSLPSTTIASGGDHSYPAEVAAIDGRFVLAAWRKESSTSASWWLDVSASLAGDTLGPRRVFLTGDVLAERGQRSGRGTTDLGREEERALFGLEGDVARATVTPERGGEVALGSRVRLTVPGSAVSGSAELQIRRPDRLELARLNAGMVNVTAPSGAGYQFLPSRSRFHLLCRKPSR